MTVTQKRQEQGAGGNGKFEVKVLNVPLSQGPGALAHSCSFSGEDPWGFQSACISHPGTVSLVAY